MVTVVYRIERAQRLIFLIPRCLVRLETNPARQIHFSFENGSKIISAYVDPNEIRLHDRSQLFNMYLVGTASSFY